VPKTYEIRCPIYGFVELSSWEREVVAQPAFQRLRRIRQLAWTDYIYPGAMHTRFEHSLGVMHMAGMLFDAIASSSRPLLQEHMEYNDAGLSRHRALVRFAALLHDVGHSPFSHAAEELFPMKTEEERYEHEDYSSAIVRRFFADVIGNHPENNNYGLSANAVADLIEGNPDAGKALFWRDVVSGQMDADRMDYLLRDSYHAGADFGQYAWRRVLNTIQAIPMEDSGLRIGVTQGGWHAAESLVLARYFMFTQMYFHKTRVAYDHHLQEALGLILPEGHFPKPTNAELPDYMEWDDWRVLGELSAGKGGDGGRRICQRNHYRCVAETPETPKEEDLHRLGQQKERLGDLLKYEAVAEKSWYKVGATDIPVISKHGGSVKPLSQYSAVVAGLQPVRKILLFVRPEDQAKALQQLHGK
jgi:uncharacterized protein